MMSERLSATDLIALIRRVFSPTADDVRLGILVDLPDGRVADHPAWKERRRMAADWAGQLQQHQDQLGLEVNLVLYRNVGMGNADLPAQVWIGSPGAVPDTADALVPAAATALEQVLSSHSLLLAPTEFSATAPLKLMAKQHGFRAATMPGFTAEMIPALRLDYGEIRRRVAIMKGLLDRAVRATLLFDVDGIDTHTLVLDLRYRQAHASDGILETPGIAGNLPSGEAYIVPYEGELPGMPSESAGRLPVQFGADVVVFEIEANRAVRATLHFEVDGRDTHTLVLDLRHRKAHASDGIIETPGTAGNLPSGEAYIVPYEGEVPGDPSQSAGRLPVQFGADVVVFEIEANKAVRVTGEGQAAVEQARWLATEPAYGNLAELGLGVLGDLGVEPTGEILLDEKLGLHVAFGRSDHFGGQVGAAQFSKPEAVVHIDRIYLPSLQPRVVPRRVELLDGEGRVIELMRDGVYAKGVL
jgi:leucyl aminopeptidase (aminopeptidase T)